MIINQNKKNMVQNKIKRYNDLMYRNGPVKIEDFLNNKYNNVHSEIFMFAIKDYLKKVYNITEEADIEDFLETHKVIEFKNDEYNLPGKMLIITRSYPYKKDVIDLGGFWNYYAYDFDNKKLVRKIDMDDETINSAHITYINYATGEVDMESKMTGIKFKLPFNEIDAGTPIAEEYSLKETYQHKIKDII